MKDKPIVSLIFVHELHKASGIRFPDDLIFLPPAPGISEEEVTIGETLVDFLFVHAMARQITPVEAEWFHVASGLLSRRGFVKRSSGFVNRTFALTFSCFRPWRDQIFDVATDVPPPTVAVEATKAAVDQDDDAACRPCYALANSAINASFDGIFSNNATTVLVASTVVTSA